MHRLTFCAVTIYKQNTIFTSKPVERLFLLRNYSEKIAKFPLQLAILVYCILTITSSDNYI